MPKVLIIEPSFAYVNLFTSHGWELTRNINDADLVQFTGGDDVSPYLYGEDVHPETCSNRARDIRELGMWKEAFDRGIPMAGICRGGQFLHVMNGGDLWQHVEGHAMYGTHEAHSLDGSISLAVTSTHHQAMRETDNGGEILLVGEVHGSCEHMFNGDIEYLCPEYSIESIYYKNSKCLCFQPHPELDSAPESCTNYYMNKLWELFGLKGAVCVVK